MPQSIVALLNLGVPEIIMILVLLLALVAAVVVVAVVVVLVVRAKNRKREVSADSMPPQIPPAKP